MTPPRTLNIGSNTDFFNVFYTIDTIVYKYKKGERIQEKQERQNAYLPFLLISSFQSQTRAGTSAGTSRKPTSLFLSLRLSLRTNWKRSNRK